MIDTDHPLYGEWCPVHGEEFQDHDCDVFDCTPPAQPSGRSAYAAAGDLAAAGDQRDADLDWPEDWTWGRPAAMNGYGDDTTHNPIYAEGTMPAREVADDGGDSGSHCDCMFCRFDELAGRLGQDALLEMAGLAAASDTVSVADQVRAFREAVVRPLLANLPISLPAQPPWLECSNPDDPESPRVPAEIRGARPCIVAYDEVNRVDWDLMSGPTQLVTAEEAAAAAAAQNDPPPGVSTPLADGVELPRLHRAAADAIREGRRVTLTRRWPWIEIEPRQEAPAPGDNSPDPYAPFFTAPAPVERPAAEWTNPEAIDFAPNAEGVWEIEFTTRNAREPGVWYVRLHTTPPLIHHPHPLINITGVE